MLTLRYENDFSISYKWNSFLQERLCTLLHFESEGFRNSEVSYWMAGHSCSNSNSNWYTIWTSSLMDQDIFNPPRCPRAPLRRGIMECKLFWEDRERLHVAPSPSDTCWTLARYNARRECNKEALGTRQFF